MDNDEDWSKMLDGHPVFALPKPFNGPLGPSTSYLELSTNTLPTFTRMDPSDDAPTPSGRRQVMVVKESDLIVAAGKEIRMTCLNDAKPGRSAPKTSKTLRTPAIQFEIHQIALNPSGKLLAVAGTFHVAVIVLPRTGFTRLVPDTVDCKSVQVGQFFHGSPDSAPIAKIEWHPWGDACSTLLVMTVDGQLREYDISVDTEEPQQVLSFVPQRKANSIVAQDSSEREVSSFTLGQGTADWGPLTVYVVMRSGDVYAICPYMPQNASVPSSYVHSLECFISAKQEFLAQGTSTSPQNLTTIYDYQHKYVTALIKQLPPGTVFPAASRSVLMHPPTIIKSVPLRQGPFLLQPSPHVLEGSEGGDATDISYLSFGADNDDDDEDGCTTEHLGVVVIAYQDGKIDICLDVDKVEARWAMKQDTNNDLPMLAVYETVDLGLVSMLGRSSPTNANSYLDLLRANHPVLVVDPINDDAFYVYHAFGVHACNLGQVLRSLATALRRADDVPTESSLETALSKSACTVVQPILATFSMERKCSNPVIAVTIPNDVYLTYSIFILTSVMRITVFPLNLRSDSPRTRPKTLISKDKDDLTESSDWMIPAEGPSVYVSLLKAEPYVTPPILSISSGLPTNPRLSIPVPDPPGSKDFLLTPDTLRFIATTVGQISSQIRDIQLAYRSAQARAVLQRQELLRLTSKCKEMQKMVEELNGSRLLATDRRFIRVQEEQKRLLSRLDRILQSLMERASPELSEHETKWFDELKRMKEEICGAAKYDGVSLFARTRQLEREYARLIPSFRKMLEREEKRRTELTNSGESLGLSQAFELGKRSNIGRMRISQVEKEISKLAEKLEISLSPLPSERGE